MVTAEQVGVLEKQDDSMLAAWWCELNGWRWPANLPQTCDRYGYEDRGEGWAIMCWIEKKVGKRLISRTWNKDMPEPVFESFWRGERGTGTPYGEWTEKRSAERVAAMEARATAVLASDTVLDDPLDAEIIG